MNTNFVRGDSFPFKFSIKNKQGDNITAEDIDTLFITCKKKTDNLSPVIFQN